MIDYVKEFEAGNTKRIIKALEKIFVRIDKCSEKQAIELKECQVTDIAHVCMVVANTDKAKGILSSFVNITNIPKLPSLDYIVRKDDTNKKYTAGYSLDYITAILNVLKHTSDNIRISLKEDSPSMIETKHFRFLLAPRIETDDY